MLSLFGFSSESVRFQFGVSSNQTEAKANIDHILDPVWHTYIVLVRPAYLEHSSFSIPYLLEILILVHFATS